MLSFDFIKKGDINIKKNNEDIIIEFQKLITVNGVENWKNKQIINLDLKDSNEGYNVKIEIQYIEHEIIKKSKIEEIDFKEFNFCPLIKLDRYLRINIPDDLLFSAQKGDKISGKIIISKIWYFGKQYGLFCRALTLTKN
jgi:hypothetical protein